MRLRSNLSTLMGSKRYSIQDVHAKQDYQAAQLVIYIMIVQQE